MIKTILLCAAVSAAILLNGCGATIAEKAVVKETIIVPAKHKAHKHHHKHYR